MRYVVVCSESSNKTTYLKFDSLSLSSSKWISDISGADRFNLQTANRYLQHFKVSGDGKIYSIKTVL